MVAEAADAFSYDNRRIFAPVHTKTKSDPWRCKKRFSFAERDRFSVMAQVFTARANIYARVLILAVVVFICGAGWLASEILWSPYTTYVDVAFDQPVPFSHKQHVGDDGIDCRYCHNSVEKSAFAGMPTSETCMACHSHLFSDAPL